MSIQLFIHIPKTAGTSLRRHLSQQFKQGLACDYGASQPLTHPVLSQDRLPGDKYYALLKAGIELVYGHIWYKNWQAYFKRSDTFAVLRHPVDRCISHYQHLLSHGDAVVSDLSQGIQQGTISLSEFATHPDMINLQSRMLDITPDNWQQVTEFRGLFISETLSREHRVKKTLNQTQRSFAVQADDIAVIIQANEFDLFIYEMVRQSWREGFWQWEALPAKASYFDKILAKIKNQSI